MVFMENNPKTFDEFLNVLGIDTPAENLDFGEFSLEAIENMSKAQLMEFFLFDKPTASAIKDSLANTSKYNKSRKEARSAKRVFPFIGTPKRQRAKDSFMDYFSDLSDVQFVKGDDLYMSLSCAAESASSDVFKDIALRHRRSHGDDPTENKNGYTPLMYAAALGRSRVLSVCLDMDSDMKKVNNKKQTTLMLAASYGHAHIIEYMAEYAKYIVANFRSSSFRATDLMGLHMKDNRGFTALHYAAFYGQLDATSQLLGLGANPNTPDDEGNTPTLLACFDKAQERCLRLLVEAGGDLEVKNKEGKNGVDIADRQSVRDMHEYARGVSILSSVTVAPRYGSF